MGNELLGRPVDSGRWTESSAAEMEWKMFVGFLVAVGIIVGLTLLGAFIARRAPGTSWESKEDRPIGGDL